MGQQKLFNEIKSHSQSQKNLRAEIDELLKGYKDQRKEKYSFWDDVVGEKIAKVAVPVRNKKGILFIKVEDSIWRFELARNKDEIIKKLNLHLKKNAVKDLVFI